jgi:hypothetical protein
MREKKSLRKVWPFEAWQLEQAAEWLESMAAQGWMLEGFSLRYAHFVRQEPDTKRFRCVSRSFFDTYLQEEACKKQFEQAGWKYIDYTFGMAIFAADQDYPVQGYDFDLHRRVKMKVYKVIKRIVFLFLLITVFMVYIYLSTSDKWDFINYLLYNNVSSCSIIALFLISLINCVWSIFELLAKNHKIMIPINKYTSQCVKPRSTRKSFCFYSMLIFMCIAAAGVAYDNVNYCTEVQEPPQDMVVLEISDILEGTGMVINPNVSLTKYDEDHELLFPEKLYIRGVSRIGQPGQSLEEYKGIYFEEKIYRALSPSMAMLLSEEWAKADAKYSIIRESKSKYGLDKIWYSDNEFTHVFLVVNGKYIYYIYYDALDFEDEPIKALSRKIKQQEALLDSTNP